MIIKDEKNPGLIRFVVDENAHDPTFVVKLQFTTDVELKDELAELTNDQYFMGVLDRKLSHIFTILHLFLDKKQASIERIEAIQQQVYDQTWIEIYNNNVEGKDAN